MTDVLLIKKWRTKYFENYLKANENTVFFTKCQGKERDSTRSNLLLYFRAVTSLVDEKFLMTYRNFSCDLF